MPTPFTHLEIAQRLLVDEALPQPICDLLQSERGAFLLGSIAADARVGSGAPRDRTHFYAYGEPMKDAPWRVMVQQNPDLLTPNDAAHCAFVAGYVAHLAVDETWSKQMVGPHFVAREWGDRLHRFYMLHIILIYMDERDLKRLESWQPDSLQSALPQQWVNFASDADLTRWRDLIHAQIEPGGESQTLEIFGERIGKRPPEMRAFLDSPQKMQSGLWDHIPLAVLAAVEQQMYVYARAQMLLYLQESGINR